jgi:hypothetical protein
MPLPKPGRAQEYARKGVELLLRQLGVAPEQRQSRQLRDQAQAAIAFPDGRKVLILTPRDWAVHVQIEGMIAQALRLRGASVEFLTCGGGLEICDRANTYEAPPMPCATCTRYVEGSIDAHGFPHRSLRSSWEAADPLPWSELDLVPADRLAAVEDGDLDLGRIVDVPLKWFLCAASLDDEPLHGQTARAFLRSARRVATALERVFDEVRPDTVLLLNGLFLFEGIAWAICRRRGIDVVTYERAFREDTLIFSRDAPAGFYDLSAAWPLEDRVLTADEERELDDYVARRRRGGASDQFWSFAPAQGVDAGPGRLVVLFTNLTWDTAVIGRDVAFPDIRAWLDAVVAAFAARPQHRLVLRIHPSEVYLPGKQTRDSLEEYIRAHHPDLPPNIRLVPAAGSTSSYELIDACDFGIVYTSTTGMELALAGKPVIVGGDVHYRGKGFTVDVNDPGEFIAALDTGLADPAGLHLDVERARRYAHYFWFRAPIRSPFVTEPLAGLARLRTTDLGDLRPGASVDLDRICDLLLAGPVDAEVSAEVSAAPEPTT